MNFLTVVQRQTPLRSTPLQFQLNKPSFLRQMTQPCVHPMSMGMNAFSFSTKEEKHKDKTHEPSKKENEETKKKEGAKSSEETKKD